MVLFYDFSVYISVCVCVMGVFGGWVCVEVRRP